MSNDRIMYRTRNEDIGSQITTYKDSFLSFYNSVRPNVKKIESILERNKLGSIESYTDAMNSAHCNSQPVSFGHISQGVGEFEESLTEACNTLEEANTTYEMIDNKTGERIIEVTSELVAFTTMVSEYTDLIRVSDPASPEFWEKCNGIRQIGLSQIPEIEEGLYKDAEAAVEEAIRPPTLLTYEETLAIVKKECGDDYPPELIEKIANSCFSKCNTYMVANRKGESVVVSRGKDGQYHQNVVSHDVEIDYGQYDFEAQTFGETSSFNGKSGAGINSEGKFEASAVSVTQDEPAFSTGGGDIQIVDNMNFSLLQAELEGGVNASSSGISSGVGSQVAVASVESDLINIEVGDNNNHIILNGEAFFGAGAHASIDTTGGFTVSVGAGLGLGGSLELGYQNEDFSDENIDF